MNKVYAVYANSDGTEGRGPMYISAVYDNLDAAVEHIIATPGVMGCRNDTVIYGHGHVAAANSQYVEEMEVLASFADRKVAEYYKARKSALAKLSPYERELLGVE